MNIVFNDISVYKKGLIESLLLTSYQDIPSTTFEDKLSFKQFDKDVEEHPQWLGKYVFFTCVKNKPIGFVSFDPRQKPLAILGHNCTLPEYQGLGFGKQQLLYAISEIQKQGFNKIIVSTCNNDYFIAAQNMYKSCGFKETKKFHKDENHVEMIGFKLDLKE